MQAFAEGQSVPFGGRRHLPRFRTYGLIAPGESKHFEKEGIVQRDLLERFPYGRRLV